MSIDEQVREYMTGYAMGVAGNLGRPSHKASEDLTRGYTNGRAHAVSVKRAERERLTALCPHCKGDPAWHPSNAVGKAGMLFGCTVCRGTGRRS